LRPIHDWAVRWSRSPGGVAGHGGEGVVVGGRFRAALFFQRLGLLARLSHWTSAGFRAVAMT
ncbi:hypothetical protein C8D92_1155, partial [Tamilnaduibacter salinus]